MIHKDAIGASNLAVEDQAVDLCSRKVCALERSSAADRPSHHYELSGLNSMPCEESLKLCEQLARILEHARCSRPSTEVDTLCNFDLDFANGCSDSSTRLPLQMAT